MIKTVYQISGSERRALEKQRNAVVTAQNSFFAVAQFIAEREGLDLANIQFNQNDLSFFTEVPEPVKE